MRHEEVIAQRRNTLAMIDADRVALVLTRNTRVPTPSGGYKTTTTVLPAQYFKFTRAGLPQTSQGTVDAGNTFSTRDQLIGRHDADIRAGDILTIDAEDYAVVEVSDTSYRKVANLLLRSERG